MTAYGSVRGWLVVASWGRSWGMVCGVWCVWVCRSGTVVCERQLALFSGCWCCSCSVFSVFSVIQAVLMAVSSTSLGKDKARYE